MDEARRGGLPPDEARRVALRRLGRPERLRETYREQRGITMTDALTQDIRYSLRMLLKSPAFTAVITLSLALGIGANTALFSLVDDLLLRTLPVRDADRLVQVRQVAHALGFKKPADVYAGPAFDQMRAQNDTLTDIVGFARLDRPAVAVDGAMEAGRRRRAGVGELLRRAGRGADCRPSAAADRCRGRRHQPWMVAVALRCQSQRARHARDGGGSVVRDCRRRAARVPRSLD